MNETRTVLINMPWAPVESPSLALSLLKAALSRAGIACEVAYLNVLWFKRMTEWHASQRIRSPLPLLLKLGGSGNGPAGECLFAAHLHHPDEDPVDNLTRILAEYPVPLPADLRADFARLAPLVPAFLRECVQAIQPETTFLAGFTSTFSQQTPALMLARALKTANPAMHVVFGGANCVGPAGAALLRYHPFVDFVFRGEADLTFPVFVERLRGGHSPADIPGIDWRQGDRIVTGLAPTHVADLDALPFPATGDYFDAIERLGFAKKVGIVATMEASRGCWWAMRVAPCTFCGLNDGRGDHRRKSPGRIVAEARHLVESSGVARIAFADTALWPKDYAGAHADIARHIPGIEQLGEIRPSLTRDQAGALARAGFTRVQPGIESFSTPILDLMRKGSTGIQNVACLKYVHDQGMVAGWNLLYGLPNERAEEYSGILETLRRITHLEPPTSVHRVRLVRYSPAFSEPDRHGYKRVRPMPYYRYLYPDPYPEEAQADFANIFAFEYADGRDPESYTVPVRRFVAEWRRHRHAGELVYVGDGDDAGRIVDTRFNALVTARRLSPMENSIYTFCDVVRSRDEILEHVRGGHGAVPLLSVNNVLERFERALWMVSEGDSYLSVASRFACATSVKPDAEAPLPPCPRHASPQRQQPELVVCDPCAHLCPPASAPAPERIATLRGRHLWDLTWEETEFVYERLHMNGYVHAAAAVVHGAPPAGRSVRVNENSVPAPLADAAQALANLSVRLGASNPTRLRIDATLMVHRLFTAFRTIERADIPAAMGLLSALAYIPVLAEKNDGVMIWPAPVVRDVSPGIARNAESLARGLDLELLVACGPNVRVFHPADATAASSLFVYVQAGVETLLTQTENGADPEAVADGFRNLEKAMMDYERRQGMHTTVTEPMHFLQRRSRHSLYLYGANHMERMGRGEEALAWYLRDMWVDDDACLTGNHLTDLRAMERLLCACRLLPSGHARVGAARALEVCLPTICHAAAEHSIRTFELLRRSPTLDLTAERWPLGDTFWLFGGPARRELFLFALMWCEVFEGHRPHDFPYAGALSVR